MNEDHKGTIFEYSGEEGADFKDFVLTKISAPENKGILLENEDKQDRPIKIYVEIVGLKDKIALSRNWGKAI